MYRKLILAHRIRISEILPWDRKSYLTHAILLRLSYEGFIHWLYWNLRTLSQSDVVMTSSCKIVSYRIQGLLKLTLKLKKNSDEKEKESIFRVRVG